MDPLEEVHQRLDDLSLTHEFNNDVDAAFRFMLEVCRAIPLSVHPEFKTLLDLAERNQSNAATDEQLAAGRASVARVADGPPGEDGRARAAFRALRYLLYPQGLPSGDVFECLSNFVSELECVDVPATKILSILRSTYEDAHGDRNGRDARR
jgi:hypothetical protein